MSVIDEIRSRLADADGMRSAALESARELRDRYIKMARDVEAQFPGLSAKTKRRTSAWTDERRARQSERMKSMWRKKAVGR